MKKYLVVSFFVAVLVPSVAFASWWNPTSWFPDKSEYSTVSVSKVWWNPISWFQKGKALDINDRPPVQNPTDITKGNSSLVSSPKEIRPKIQNTVPPIIPNSQKEKVETGTISKDTTNIDVQTTRTCMNGVVISVNDVCTKVCPDGETVLEKLQCKNPPTSTVQNSKGVLCNGTYWSACPLGQDFVCPATGNAHCQTSQSQQMQENLAIKTSALEKLQTQLQIYKNQYADQYNEVSRIKNQYDQLNQEMNTKLENVSTSGSWTSRALGEQGQIKNQYAANLSSISETYYKATQLLSFIQGEITDIQQRVNAINAIPLQ